MNCTDWHADGIPMAHLRHLEGLPWIAYYWRSLGANLVGSEGHQGPAQSEVSDKVDCLFENCKLRLTVMLEEGTQGVMQGYNIYELRR